MYKKVRMLKVRAVSFVNETEDVSACSVYSGKVVRRYSNNPLVVRGQPYRGTSSRAAERYEKLVMYRASMNRVISTLTMHSQLRHARRNFSKLNLEVIHSTITF